MDYLCAEADAEALHALEWLRQARAAPAIPGPLEAVARLISLLPRLKEWPNGSFVDIREILDLDGYARL